MVECSRIMHTLSRKLSVFLIVMLPTLPVKRNCLVTNEAEKIHEIKDVYQYLCVLSKCTLANGVSI